MKHEALLFTADLSSARAEIEALGGSVLHRLGERVFVALLPEPTEGMRLEHSSPQAPGSLDESDRLVARAWRGRGEKLDADKMARDEGLPWDAPGHKAP